jgi:hypothetical protein
MAMDWKNLGDGPIEASVGAIDYTHSVNITALHFSVDRGSHHAGTMGDFGLYFGGFDRTVFGRSAQSLVFTPIEVFHE